MNHSINTIHNYSFFLVYFTGHIETLQRYMQGLRPGISSIGGFHIFWLPFVIDIFMCSQLPFCNFTFHGKYITLSRPFKAQEIKSSWEILGYKLCSFRHFQVPSLSDRCLLLSDSRFSHPYDRQLGFLLNSWSLRKQSQPFCFVWRVQS